MSQAQEETKPRTPRAIDVLWRRALGETLREMRIARGERLDDTARRAGISPQYLSEMERGRKDPSSEMIGAVIGALESNLAEVLPRVAESLGSRSAPVIDIRSTVGVGTPNTTSMPGRNSPSEVKLSIAA